MADSADITLHKVLKTEGTTFAGIFAVGFVLFLAIALVAQIGGLHWRSWFPGAEGGKSVIAGVKDAVYTFMSHLL